VHIFLVQKRHYIARRWIGTIRNKPQNSVAKAKSGLEDKESGIVFSCANNWAGVKPIQRLSALVRWGWS
jgi:hypothetical protein